MPDEERDPVILRKSVKYEFSLGAEGQITEFGESGEVNGKFVVEPIDGQEITLKTVVNAEGVEETVLEGEFRIWKKEDRSLEFEPVAAYDFQKKEWKTGAGFEFFFSESTSLTVEGGQDAGAAYAKLTFKGRF